MHIGFRRRWWRRRRRRRQRPRGTIQQDITFKRDFIYSADYVTPTPRYALPPSFLLPTTRFRTRRHFLRLLSSVSPIPVSFPAVIPPTNRYQMEKIELVRATLVIIAWPPILPLDRYHGLTYWSYCLALTTSVQLTRTYGTLGNSSNFSYVNFMQNFPASVVVYIANGRSLFLFPSLSLSFFFNLSFYFFYSLAQSESARAPTGGGRIGARILEILAEYIFRQSHPFRNASKG